MLTYCCCHDVTIYSHHGRDILGKLGIRVVDLIELPRLINVNDTGTERAQVRARVCSCPFISCGK